MEEEEPKQMKNWEEEYDNLLKLAQYQKAEFENYKKRNAESVIQSFDDGKVFAIKIILPLLDALKEAFDQTQEEGLEILIRKFNSGLESLGLNEIPTDGKFDPHVHECVATEQVEDIEPDTIISVWQKGYTMGKKVIRPAMVKLSN